MFTVPAQLTPARLCFHFLIRFTLASVLLAETVPLWCGVIVGRLGAKRGVYSM